MHEQFHSSVLPSSPTRTLAVCCEFKNHEGMHIEKSGYDLASAPHAHSQIILMHCNFYNAFGQVIDFSAKKCSVIDPLLGATTESKEPNKLLLYVHLICSKNTWTVYKSNAVASDYSTESE